MLKHGRLGETYNVGGGAEMANIDLIGLLCDELDRRFAADKSLAASFPRGPAASGGSTRKFITFVKDRPGHDRRYAICAAQVSRRNCAGGRAPSHRRLVSRQRTLVASHPNRCVP